VRRPRKFSTPTPREPAGNQLLLAFDSYAAQQAPDVLPLRRVVTANGTIDYVLQRVRRRTVGFQINDGGLTVRALRWSTLREIEAAILDNQRWIRSKQVAWRAWREKQQGLATRVADGGQVQYLGRTATLRWVPGFDEDVPHFEADTYEIWMPSLPASTPLTLDGAAHDCLRRWLQSQAAMVIGARLDQFAGRADARFKGWRLSTARTQWGSCSHDGRIRLNWRLVHFSLPVIDYVVAHELAHLRELNHSVRFWKVVAQLLPGFEAARDQIKRVDIRALTF